MQLIASLWLPSLALKSARGVTHVTPKPRSAGCSCMQQETWRTGSYITCTTRVRHVQKLPVGGKAPLLLSSPTRGRPLFDCWAPQEPQGACTAWGARLPNCGGVRFRLGLRGPNYPLSRRARRTLPAGFAPCSLLGVQPHGLPTRTHASPRRTLRTPERSCREPHASAELSAFTPTSQAVHPTTIHHAEARRQV
jgi:hypothetical protein